MLYRGGRQSARRSAIGRSFSSTMGWRPDRRWRRRCWRCGSRRRRAIVVAVPVGARETCERLRRLADAGRVRARRPSRSHAVGAVVRGLRADDRRGSDAAAGRAPAEASADPTRTATTTPWPSSVQRAMPLAGDPTQYDALLDGIGDARVVLLGEATHGTHEFYRERAFITRRLIAEKGFTAVAVEADWPDAYRVNRYVRGDGPRRRRRRGARRLRRFPTWMWRNADVLDFIGWLRTHNDAQPGGHARRLLRPRPVQPARVDAGGARVSRQGRSGRGPAARAQRYGCFDQFGEEMQEYGYAAGTRLRRRRASARSSTQLVELQRRRGRVRPSRDGRVAADEFFFAEQNARLVRNAEEYYRTMFRGRAESWNLRDRHMVDTLARAGAASSSGRRPRRPASSSGRTTRIWATRGRRRWASAAS